MAKRIADKVVSIVAIGSGYWGDNIVCNFYQLDVLKLIYDNKDNIVNQLKKTTP